MKPNSNALDPASRSAVASMKLREMFGKNTKGYEVYRPQQHNPAAPQRENSNDAMLLPSRVDDLLIYRDGQVSHI